MSLLTDQLSEATPGEVKEVKNSVPPGLKNTVDSSRKKKKSRKRLFLILIILVSFVGTGIFTLLMIPDSEQPAPVMPDNSQYLNSLKQSRVAQKQPSTPDVPDNQTAGMTVSKPGDLKAAAPPDKNTALKDVKKTVQVKKTASVAGAEKAGALQKKEVVGKSEVTAAQTPQNQIPTAAAVLPLKTASRPADMSIEKSASIQSPDKTELKTFSENIETSRRAVPLSPEDKRSKLLKASYYEEIQDYRKAIAVYEKILASEPGNDKLMNKVAYLLMQLDLPDGAMEHLNRALAINPEYVPALLNAGIIHGRAKRFTAAEEVLLEALAIEPNNRNALFNTALLYEIKGEFDKSREYYLKLQASGDRQGTEGIKRLEQMRSLTEDNR